MLLMFIKTSAIASHHCLDVSSSGTASMITKSGLAGPFLCSHIALCSLQKSMNEIGCACLGKLAESTGNLLLHSLLYLKYLTQHQV